MRYSSQGHPRPGPHTSAALTSAERLNTTVVVGDSSTDLTTVAKGIVVGCSQPHSKGTTTRVLVSAAQALSYLRGANELHPASEIGKRLCPI